MAVLFDVGIPAISKHLTNVFETGELSEEATISKMETVQHEGNRDVKRMVVMYKLDLSSLWVIVLTASVLRNSVSGQPAY